MNDDFRIFSEEEMEIIKQDIRFQDTIKNLMDSDNVGFIFFNDFFYIQGESNSKTISDIDENKFLENLELLKKYLVKSQYYRLAAAVFSYGYCQFPWNFNLTDSKQKKESD